MNKTYQQEIRQCIALIIVSIGLMAMHQLVFRGRLTFMAHWTAPISTRMHYLGTTSNRLWERITTIQKVFDENQSLRDQVVLLTASEEERKRLLGENETLKNQLNIKPPPNYQQIMSEISGINLGASDAQEVLINKGTTDGVTAGDPVIFNQVLVGTISLAQEYQSAIRLTTHPDSKITALIQSKSDKSVEGVLTGSFGVKLLLTQVLQSDPLQSGEVVTTSGKDGKYPSGLLLGKIDTIITTDADVFREANVIPFYDTSKLQIVFVLHKESLSQ